MVRHIRARTRARNRGVREDECDSDCRCAEHEEQVQDRLFQIELGFRLDEGRLAGIARMFCRYPA